MKHSGYKFGAVYFPDGPKNILTVGQAYQIGYYLGDIFDYANIRVWTDYLKKMKHEVFRLTPSFIPAYKNDVPASMKYTYMSYIRIPKEMAQLELEHVKDRYQTDTELPESANVGIRLQFRPDLDVRYVSLPIESVFTIGKSDKHSYLVGHSKANDSIVVIKHIKDSFIFNFIEISKTEPLIYSTTSTPWLEYKMADILRLFPDFIWQYHMPYEFNCAFKNPWNIEWFNIDNPEECFISQGLSF